MTKFIKLTEANNSGRKLLLNISHIGTIQAGNSVDTYVRMTYTVEREAGKQRAEYYFVKESLEQIEKLLYTTPIVIKDVDTGEVLEIR